MTTASIPVFESNPVFVFTLKLNELFLFFFFSKMEVVSTSYNAKL